MDLMKGSTTYAQLAKKYYGFRAPSVEVLVDGTQLVKQLSCTVDDVSVDLTCGYEASGASFNIKNQYVQNQTKFDAKGCYSKVQLGAKVEIKLGHVKTEKVFSGYISTVEYVFGDEDDKPYIHVECVDVKCLLMKFQRVEVRAEKDVSKLVTALLGESPVGSYLDGKEIKFTQSQKQLRLQMDMKSDYDYIVELAQYMGCEFFIICGKAYFREKPASASAVMTLSPRAGIRRAQMSLRGESLVNKVSVVTIDPATDKLVSGSATISGKFGKGSGPKKMMGSSERTYIDPLSISAKEAADRAKIIMGGLREKFGSIEIETVGIPELVPGRDVKVSGLMPDAEQTFYITAVHHSVGPDGYVTTTEARIDTL